METDEVRFIPISEFFAEKFDFYSEININSAV